MPSDELPDSVFEALKEEITETKEVTRQEAIWLDKKEKEEIKKESTTPPKKEKVNPILSSKEKKRIRLVSDSLFKTVNNKIREAAKVNDYRNRMREMSNFHMKEKAEAVIDMAKESGEKIFEKAIKLFLGAGLLWGAWKLGVFDVFSPKNLISGAIRFINWVNTQLPILIKEVPARLTKMFGLFVENLKRPNVRGFLDNFASFVQGRAGRAMMNIFDNLLKNYAGHLEMIGFAMEIISWALTGATIGSIIPGVGTALGAAVGAIVGSIIGVYKFIKNKKNTPLRQTEKKFSTALHGAMVEQVVINKEVIKINKTLKKPNTPLKKEEQNNLATKIQQLKEKQQKTSERLKMLQLYRNFFVGSGGTTDNAYPSIWQIFKKLGIEDEIKLNGPEKRDDLDGRFWSNISAVGGVPFDQQHPEHIINKTKEILRPYIEANSIGTVIEGEGFTAEQIAKITEYDTLLKSGKTIKEDFRELIGKGKPTVSRVVERDLLRGSYYRGYVGGIELFDMDGKPSNEMTDFHDKVHKITISEFSKEHIEEKGIDKVIEKRKNYERIMKSDEIEKVVNFFSLEDDDTTKEQFQKLKKFFSDISSLKIISDAMTAVAEMLSNSIRTFVESLNTQKTTFSFSKEDNDFITDIKENQMLSVIRILKEGTSFMEFFEWTTPYNDFSDDTKEPLEHIKEFNKAIQDKINKVSFTENIETDAQGKISVSVSNKKSVKEIYDEFKKDTLTEEIKTKHSEVKREIHSIKDSIEEQKETRKQSQALTLVTNMIPIGSQLTSQAFNFESLENAKYLLFNESPEELTPTYPI